MKLSEFVDINPRTSLPKGTEAEFVPMEALSPQRRYVRTYPKKKYSGGAKFINGDTLFARITPCLENGKISQFVSDSNLPAFGSTEYWILRAKEGISDPSYVYYLAKSEVLRRPAEKSMVGASGRQRAQIESVQDIDIGDISLEEQKKIAGALSAYDDLIENNSKRIEKLEAMARMLFNDWYDKFLLTHHESIPVTDLFEIKYGKTLPKTKFQTDGTYPIYGGGGVIGFYDKSTFSEPVCLITSRGNGSGTVWRTIEAAFVTNNSFTVTPKIETKGLSAGFIQLLMERLPIKSALSGSAQPQLTIDSLSHIYSPHISYEDAENVNGYITSIFSLIYLLQRKNQKLAKARDLLLPRLMSGEIEV